MHERRQILVIDLLRVAAALAVVLHHLVAIAPATTDGPFTWFATSGHLPLSGAWAAPGWIGVEVFFVISGYVIARSADGVTAQRFLVRRALRLVPAAWVCASLTALALLGWSVVPVAEIAVRWASAMLFWPREQMIDPSYWTLEAEVAFYLLVALAVRHGGARTAERATMAVGLVSTASLLFMCLMHIAPSALDTVPLRLALLPHGVFFALGSLLATVHAREVSGRALLCGVAFAAGALAEITLHARAIAYYVPDGPGAWLPVALFAAAVLLIAWADRVQQPLARWIGSARLLRASAATYPLYLLHQVIGAALIAAGVAAGLSPSLATVLAIVGVVVLAVAISEHAEPALKAVLLRLFSVRHAPAPDSRVSASPRAG